MVTGRFTGKLPTTERINTSRTRVSTCAVIKPPRKKRPPRKLQYMWEKDEFGRWDRRVVKNRNYDFKN